MLYFKYKKNELFCEGVKVAEICKNFNTPFYLYSSKTLINNYKLNITCNDEVYKLQSCFDERGKNNYVFFK